MSSGLGARVIHDSSIPISSSNVIRAVDDVMQDSLSTGMSCHSLYDIVVPPQLVRVSFSIRLQVMSYSRLSFSQMPYLVESKLMLETNLRGAS